MKTIDTLIEDIETVLKDGIEVEEAALEDMWESFKATLVRQITPREGGGYLRMSNVGTPCARKLWYQVNEHDHKDREVLDGHTKFKFLYGDLTEELVLFLAKLSGHSVEGLQDEMEIEGIKGHRDAVIDGVLVDVKSASSYAFQKFKNGTLEADDPFGYIPQLMSYLYASQDDPLVKDKDRAAFLAFDKQLGHLCLDFHDKVPWFNEIPAGFRRRKELVAGKIPDRDFMPVPDGKSGNEMLGTYCSYCDFKRVCYPKLRTFLYSGRPRFLTTVKKEPNVPEA